MNIKPFALLLIGGMMMLMGLSYFVLSSQNFISPVAQSRHESLVVETMNGTKHSFTVEIADTPELAERGLMYRKEMAADHGMLFETGTVNVASFWMKNTFIPLDIIFIAADGTVKTIHENAEPQSLEKISSQVPVYGILEINGGEVKKRGIAVGDKILHPYFIPSP